MNHVSFINDNHLIPDVEEPLIEFLIPVEVIKTDEDKALYPDQFTYCATVDVLKNSIILYSTLESTGDTKKITLPLVVNGQFLPYKDIYSRFINAMRTLERVLLGDNRRIRRYTY